MYEGIPCHFSSRNHTFFQRKTQGKSSTTTVKLDITKAFNRIEWPFLQAMLLALGFPMVWVWMVMHCVTSITFRIKSGADLLDQIIPSRGIRQGDPYHLTCLFYVWRVVTALLNWQVRLENIQGCKVARNALAISSLMFKDDSLVFFKASTSQVESLKFVLQSFEMASSLLVNLRKYVLLFNKNNRHHLQCTTDLGSWPAIIIFESNFFTRS